MAALKYVHLVHITSANYQVPFTAGPYMSLLALYLNFCTHQCTIFVGSVFIRAIVFDWRAVIMVSFVSVRLVFRTRYNEMLDGSAIQYNIAGGQHPSIQG